MAYRYTLADEDQLKFYTDRAARMLHCREAAVEILGCVDRYREALAPVEAEGMTVIRDFFARERIEQLRNTLETMIQTGDRLTPIRDHAAESRGDIEAGTFKFVTQEQIA